MPIATNVEDIYELSPLQEGMLFHTLLAPEANPYFVQSVSSLPGTLDVAAFGRAWNEVVARNPILRTSFHWEEIDKPLQVVRRQVDLPMTCEDWRPCSASELDTRLAAFLEADRQRGFDMAEPPLMRLALFRVGQDAYQFVFSFHHILLDGWSLQLVNNEVVHFYDAFSRNRAGSLPRSQPYGAYIGWVQQQDTTECESFWRHALAGITAPTPLGGLEAFGGDGARSQAGGERVVELSGPLSAALQRVAREHRVTLNTLFQGAWALLLSRYSGETDVLFGITVSGRSAPLEGIDSMIGLLINTMPLRVKVREEESIGPWLRDLQSQQADLRRHEHASLVQVQGWSEFPRGQPLFETLLVFENYPSTLSMPERAGGSGLHQRRAFGRTHYPLTLIVMPGSEIVLTVQYDGRRICAESVDGLLGHLQQLLGALASDTGALVCDLPILTDRECHELLIEWNATAAPLPHDTCLHDLVQAQVGRTPDAVAAACGEEEITYRDLNRRANQLASCLRTRGVGPNVPVGVCLERSMDLIVSLLAVLKAGGAYVPLSPAYPAERVAYMLDDTHAPVVLSDRRTAERLLPPSAAVLCVDEERARIEAEPATDLPRQATPDSLAYVIYTSGSTGRPKGVMNTHAGICNRLLWMQDAYGLTADDQVLQKTPFTFDVSVWEFFWPLLAGARVVLARPGDHVDMGALVRTIAERRITTVHFVPSVLQCFLNEPDVTRCTSLRRVVCSGEALGADLQKAFFERFDADLHNLYGPTEAAIDVTAWTCRPEDDGGRVPIGRPIANTQIYVLDRRLRPVPVGVAGEIHIGGVGVARGYLNLPELTAASFFPDPFSTDRLARLYKTGDLGRYRPDGAIEFLGRIDRQVKLRGVRVELGEVEAVIRQHTHVQAAAADVRRDDAGNEHLVAYVVARTPAFTAGVLRAYLRERLPEQLVPTRLVFVQAMPLTSSGKLDYKQLPDPASISEPVATYVAPRDPVEREISELVANVLGVARVGITDNFFELGAHSLLATRLVSKIRAAFQVELPLRRLFETPTVAALAQAVAEYRMSPRPAAISRIERQVPRSELPQVDELGEADVDALLQHLLVDEESRP